MHNYLAGLEQRNGTACVEQLAIALTRVHFKPVDDPAPATGVDSAALFDAAGAEALEDL